MSVLAQLSKHEQLTMNCTLKCCEIAWYFIIIFKWDIKYVLTFKINSVDSPNKATHETCRDCAVIKDSFPPAPIGFFISTVWDKMKDYIDHWFNPEQLFLHIFNWVTKKVDVTQN